MSLISPSIVMACDLVWLPRVSRALTRYGDRWLERLLTPEERAYCTANDLPERRQIERIAARLAVKESVAKLLGVGVCGLGYQEGIRWREVSFDGYRQILLTGRALKHSQEKEFRYWQASVAHDGDYAMATVLAQS